MKQVVGWIAVGVTAVFVALNLDRAHVWFFGIRADMPVAFVVLASAFLGALATYALSGLKGRK